MAQPGPAAPGNPELDQPALMSPRALTAAMTAAVRAGGRLVAAGERGIVLLSDDEGMTWRQAGGVPVSVTLTGLRFVSAAEGWAIGHSGVVLHTRDGGETWTRQLDGVRAAELALAGALALPESPRRTAFVKEATRLIADGPDKPLLDIDVTDAEHVLVVGAYGLAMRSGDGGRTWSSVIDQFDNPRGLHIYKLACDASGCFAVGEQGILLSGSRDREHYALRPSPYQGTLFGVLCLRDRLLAYGLRGTLLRSDDAGRTWARLETGLEAGLVSSLVRADGRILLGTLNGALLESNDDGGSFHLLHEPMPFAITALVEVAGGLVMTGQNGPVRVLTRDGSR